MDIDEFVRRLEQRPADRFQAQIRCVQNLNVRKALKQVNWQLMQRGVDKAHALVGEHISVGRVCELRLVVGSNMLEEARKLFSALIRNFGQATDIKIATTQIDRRCCRAVNRHEDPVGED